MGVQTILKEISLENDQLTMSVAIFCDDYKDTSHAPRVEIIFSTEKDSRRTVIPVNSFEKDTDSDKGVAYATYVFNLPYLFWNCTWKDCQFYFDIDYEGTLYHKTPFEVEFAADPKHKIFRFEEDIAYVHVHKAIDSSIMKLPNLIESILSILIHLGNLLISILLLPWFCIDTCCRLFLHTDALEKEIQGSKLKQFIFYLSYRFFTFDRNPKLMTGFKSNFFTQAYCFFNALHPKKKGILFLSNRREDLTGNFEYVYEQLKDRKGLEISFWLHPQTIRDAGFGVSFDLARKAAKAKVIIVDDHIPLFDFWRVSDKTKIVQLWHACGAFKTFGFSRLGKKGAPTQKNISHRNYSYAFVSSKAIAKYYAEGFGLAEDKVLSYGIPRTDMFFDEKKKNEIIHKLYSSYPQLKDKKIVMFAPTFRGDGKNSAFYEKQRFHPEELISHLPEDTVLIIKHHPFVSLKYKIDEQYKNRIFDFSKESEINDLLFITDLLITDYSSVVYEASLLNIPMLFYAYDLENYVATRDFYSNYEYFVPGKIVRTEEELCEAILSGEYEQEKVKPFCERNFDIRDGRASVRVADFIEKLAND